MLVTGALGFIGYHLCVHMTDMGYEVFGIDNLSRGMADRLRIFRGHGVEVTLIDVRDLSALTEYMLEVRPEAVIHLAALISVEESFEKPLLYEDVNVKGTISTVLASNKAGVWKFIYVSSAAVYGNPKYLPIDEEHPTIPLSPYGVTKLAGEYFSKMLFKGEGRTVILRLFNVYGPGQSPEYAGVITKFMERLMKGEPPVIYGDGEQARDFIYITDVVEAIEKAVKVDVRDEVILNVGTGKPTTIKELAHKMIRVFGADVEPVYAPPRKGDIRYSYANIGRAAAVLKWVPKVSLDDGLRSLVYYTV